MLAGAFLMMFFPVRGKKSIDCRKVSRRTGAKAWMDLPLAVQW